MSDARDGDLVHGQNGDLDPVVMLEKSICVIEFDGCDADAKPFDAMNRDGCSIACEWSKSWDQLLVNAHGGSLGFQAPNRVSIAASREKGRLLWVAPDVTLCDEQWNPCSAESLGYALVADPSAALKLMAYGHECSDQIWCRRCEDWLPDGDDPCEHIWYCGTRGGYAGEGVSEEDMRKRCPKKEHCEDCDRHGE